MLQIFSHFRDSENDPLFLFLKSKYQNKPITIFYERFPESIEELNFNPYNFLIILEPNEFFGLHNYAITNQKLFTGIITWSDLVHKNCDNGIQFTFNGRVLDDEFCKQIENKEKKFEVSFLCGDKNLVEGHKLRHKVFEIGPKIKIPKKWFYVLDDYDKKTNTRPGYADYSKDLSHIPNGVDPLGFGKRILFEESMFNVVIENVNHLNWYNKIGDNFFSKTVPIYWGCPNIEEFGYDERGIIRFQNENELIQIINNLTIEKYKEMKPFIEHNFEVAKLDDLENRMAQLFDQFIELNNL